MPRKLVFTTLVLMALGTSGCKDPGGPLTVTFRIHNFATSCTENTLYYKVRWKTETGEDESLTTAVPPGGVSTFFVPAYDSANDGDKAADLIAYEYSIFDPDPVLGCGTAASGFEDILNDGDVLTVTVDADGIPTDEISLASTDSLLSWAENGVRELMSTRVSRKSQLTQPKPIADPHVPPRSR
ncbi:MAG: hypothetical protein SFV23_23475 [Planctomycetaceae bacterium]|nr:hypothetical protein [Planctomycetaceae bacterium]